MHMACGRTPSLTEPNPPSSLKYQCESETFESICDALAEVYYAAVKAFGGDDATPGKRSSSSESRQTAAEWAAIYQEKVDAYNKLVAEAGLEGAIGVPSNATARI